MAHLRQQFKEALGKIEPSQTDKANAPLAHKAVRDVLAASERLSSFGISPVLIGSYKRNVSIRRVKDVDVFVRFEDLPEDVTAKNILDTVFRVLHEAFGVDADGHRRVKRQSRSLMVTFPEYDLDVDAVPARPSADVDGAWEIPQKNTDDDWVLTNPEKLTVISSEMNAAHGEFYVPTVKLLRQTRRTLLGSARPGGFSIETATYEAFQTGAATGTDQAEYYVSTLKAVSSILDNLVYAGAHIPDPTLPGRTIVTNASNEELQAARAAFTSAADAAEVALMETDEGKSALGFRGILGKNGDEDTVFPMPPGFNEDGSRRATAISAGARDVPAGSRTFG